MKLNTKSRYAVMALADMARFDGKNPVSLRYISLRQSISLLLEYEHGEFQIIMYMDIQKIFSGNTNLSI